MVCTRKTKTLVSTCVILSGMTNIVCLLYVGWVTNYIASVYVKVQEPISEKKLEEGKEDTLRIIERLDHLENVIKQHIQGTTSLLVPALLSPSPPPRCFLCAVSRPLPPRSGSVCVCGARRSCRERRGTAPLPGSGRGSAEAALRVGVPGGARRGGTARTAAPHGPGPPAERRLQPVGSGREVQGGGSIFASRRHRPAFAVFQNASAVLNLLPREPER